MKLSKKLFAAAATLGLALAATVGSTYAWFSLNTTVTATNMTVQVKAQKNLLITATSGDFTGNLTSVNLAQSKSTLVPTSCDATNETLKWYKVNSSTGVSFSTGEFGDATTFMEADSETDYLKVTFYIKSVGADASNLKASVTKTAGGTHVVDPAYRVLIVVAAAGAQKRVYAPIPEHSATYKSISSLDAQNKPNLSDQNVALATTENLLDSLTADTQYTVDAYIWCEGQDAACTSSNAVSLASTTFQIALTVS